MNCFIVSAYKIGHLKKRSMTVFYNLLIVPVGYSGYQDYYPYGRPGYQEDVRRNYDAYTAGLSEEEQLERALRASLWDRGRNLAPFTSFKSYLTWWDGLTMETLNSLWKGYVDGKMCAHCDYREWSVMPYSKLPRLLRCQTMYVLLSWVFL